LAGTDCSDRNPAISDPGDAEQGSIRPTFLGTPGFDQASFGRRQQLREDLKIPAAGGADLQRCVHVDADHVAARRKPELALAGYKHLPRLVLRQARLVLVHKRKSLKWFDESRFFASKARRLQVDFGVKPLIPKHNPQPPEPTMRQERTVQASLFDLFAGHEIGRELRTMSAWLDEHRELSSLVGADLRQHGVKETGRPACRRRRCCAAPCSSSTVS
jgi:hypothetical protein